MKLLPELVTAVLWGLAAGVTAMLTAESGQFTYLGPLFAICAIGGVMTVRWSKGRDLE